MVLSEKPRIELFLGDCLEIMPTLPDKSIDMVLCDLPYGTTACSWDVVIPFEPLWKEYKRLIKDNGVIVLMGIEPFTSYLVSSNIKDFKEKLTWIKHRPSNIGNAKYMHLKYTEDIVIFAKGKHTYNPQMQQRISDRVRQAQKGNSKQWRTNKKDTHDVSFASTTQPRSWHTFNSELKYPSNAITLPAVVSNSLEKTIHPTQKPVALFEYLIKTYSNEDDIVMDNCLGSGTTAIACCMENRNCIGIEKERKYYDLSLTRFRQFSSQQTLTF